MASGIMLSQIKSSLVNYKNYPTILIDSIYAFILKNVFINSFSTIDLYIDLICIRN